MRDIESGFLEDPEEEFGMSGAFTDITVLRTGSVSLIARATRYGRQWLLKGLRPELRQSPFHLRQMQKEFDIQLRLRGLPAARALALETAEGLGPCIVEEWIEGPDLRQHLLNGSLPARQRRRLMAAILSAVAAIHARGVVHRDLKPSNILVEATTGEIVIIDFGLADTSDYAELKQPAGTPGYIAPEQTDRPGGRPADDVYSLGIIMREVCPQWKRVAARCTAPETHRPKDAGEVVRLLKKRKRSRRIASVAFALALLGIGAWGLGTGIHARMEGMRRQAAESAMRIGQLETRSSRDRREIEQLSDSLTRVTGRMLSAEEELRQQQTRERLKTEFLKRGRKEIDAIYRRADQGPIQALGPGDGEAFQKELMKLQKEVDLLLENLRLQLAPLPETEAEKDRLLLEVYNYHLQMLTKYQKGWMKKINPGWGEK